MRLFCILNRTQTPPLLTIKKPDNAYESCKGCGSLSVSHLTSAVSVNEGAFGAVFSLEALVRSIASHTDLLCAAQSSSQLQVTGREGRVQHPACERSGIQRKQFSLSEVSI